MSLSELIDRMERDAFEKWASDDGKWNMAVSRSGDGYLLSTTQVQWDAWKARASFQRPCRGVSHPGCNYLAQCGSICDKCGQQT